MPLNATLPSGTVITVPQHDQRQLAIRLLCALLDDARSLLFDSNPNAEDCERLEWYLSLPCDVFAPVPAIWDKYVDVLESDPEPKDYLGQVIELLKEAAEALDEQTDEEFLEGWDDCSDRYKLLLAVTEQFRPLGGGYWEYLTAVSTTQPPTA